MKTKEQKEFRKMLEAMLTKSRQIQQKKPEDRTIQDYEELYNLTLVALEYDNEHKILE